jgi:hypothetical protein
MMSMAKGSLKDGAKLGHLVGHGLAGGGMAAAKGAKSVALGVKGGLGAAGGAALHGAVHLGHSLFGGHDRQGELRRARAADCGGVEGRGKRWFVIEAGFMRDWAAWVKGKPGRRPPSGGIDNGSLLDEATGAVRRDLVVVEQYRRINEASWVLFSGLYGGGPAISVVDQGPGSLEPYRDGSVANWQVGGTDEAAAEAGAEGESSEARSEAGVGTRANGGISGPVDAGAARVPKVVVPSTVEVANPISMSEGLLNQGQQQIRI